MRELAHYSSFYKTLVEGGNYDITGVGGAQG